MGCFNLKEDIFSSKTQRRWQTEYVLPSLQAQTMAPTSENMGTNLRTKYGIIYGLYSNALSFIRIVIFPQNASFEAGLAAISGLRYMGYIFASPFPFVFFKTLKIIKSCILKVSTIKKKKKKSPSFLLWFLAMTQNKKNFHFG